MSSTAFIFQQVKLRPAPISNHAVVCNIVYCISWKAWAADRILWKAGYVLPGRLGWFVGVKCQVSLIDGGRLLPDVLSRLLLQGKDRVWKGVTWNKDKG